MLVAGGEGGSSEEVEAEIVERAAKSNMSEEVFRAHVAGGVVIEHLINTRTTTTTLSGSVYDAAMVMPQLGRSCGWSSSLAYLAAESYLLGCISFGLQIFFLYMVELEAEVMDKFAGQMNLCDFGAMVETCPGGSNCIGPGGTNYDNPGRLYKFNVWLTRTFLRDSLATLLAGTEQEAEIAAKIDPGEYGLENYWCRIMAVFLYLMILVFDLLSTIDMAKITQRVPNDEEPWMKYNVPAWASKDHIKKVFDYEEIDLVTFKLAGMPVRWKVINWMFIILPKLWIWYVTAHVGVHFLMESDAINSTIINVTALTFILNLDEMVYEAFSHKAVLYIMEKLEPFVAEDSDDWDHEEDIDDALSALAADKQQSALYPLDSSMWGSAWRLLMTLACTIFFVAKYYCEHCEFSALGGLVSDAAYLPKTSGLPFTTFVFPWENAPANPTPYWSMPNVTAN
jgi:hypothetical protein